MANFIGLSLVAGRALREPDAFLFLFGSALGLVGGGIFLGCAVWILAVPLVRKANDPDPRKVTLIVAFIVCALYWLDKVIKALNP